MKLDNLPQRITSTQEEQGILENHYQGMLRDLGVSDICQLPDWKRRSLRQLLSIKISSNGNGTLDLEKTLEARRKEFSRRFLEKIVVFVNFRGILVEEESEKNRVKKQPTAFRNL